MTLKGCITLLFHTRAVPYIPPCKQETTFFPLERLLTVLCAWELRSHIATLWHLRLVVT